MTFQLGGGSGEFHTWRFGTTVPSSVAINVMWFDQMPLPGEEDTRIMNFDIRDEDKIYIVLAFSNGKIRGVSYEPGLNPGTGR